jgi:hypothetical protein
MLYFSQIYLIFCRDGTAVFQSANSQKVPESAEIDARKTEILTVQLRDDKPVSWSVGFSRSTRTD